jgi:hypothetical protein
MGKSFVGNPLAIFRIVDVVQARWKVGRMRNRSGLHFPRAAPVMPNFFNAQNIAAGQLAMNALLIAQRLHGFGARDD